MSGIAKLKNRVTVGGDPTPWRGEVVDLQYSISFEGSSSLSITVANNEGVYDDPVLNSTTPSKIEFGICTLMMLPISFKKSKGGGKGRTMTVTFEDLGVRYLDKNVVLLKNQHLANDGLTPCTMVLGKNFMPNGKGVLTRWWGGWKPEGLSVLYDIRDLAIAIDEHGIPISTRFYDFLKQFKAYMEGDEANADECLIESFLRSDSGVLRGIISTVCGELGVIPFWNNEDGIGGPALGTRASIRNAKADGSGFLDFLNLAEDIDKNNIESSIASLLTSCNVEDDSYEVSIKNSFLKGGIGSFSVNPERIQSGRTSFKRLRFGEDISSSFTGKKVGVKGDYEMSLLMRAAMSGPEFYKNYVLQKLAASYVKDMKTNLFKALYDRDQGDEKDARRFDFVDTPTRKEGGEEFPFGIVINEAVDKLYKGDKFELIPCGYSIDIEFGGKWNKKNALGVAGQIALNNNEPIIGTDSKYYDLLQDEAFMGSLRGNEGADGSDFIAILAKQTPEMNEFLENPGQDLVYQQLVFFAEHYARWYTAGLITGKSFSARNYSSADVQAYFSDLAVIETPIGAIYSRYKTSGVPVSDDKLWDTGNYYINWGGQAECGYKFLPDNTIELPERNLQIKDAYQHIIGIRTFINNGADAVAERTTCTDGQRERDLPTKRTITTGPPGTFRSESYSIRTDRDLDLEQECVETKGMTCTLLGGTILPGKAKSITSEQLGQANFRRTNCTRGDNIARGGGGACSSGEDITFELPTDNDFMVMLHDNAGDPAPDAGTPDTAMGFTMIDKSNSFSDTDSYWRGNNVVLGLECVKGGGVDFEVKEGYKTTWGARDLDYWDYQLMTQVSPTIDTQRVRNKKKIYYTYNFAELLQGLRCSYIPNDHLDKVTQIDVQDIKFDIGQLVKNIPFPLEYEVCDDRSYFNLPEAERNLVRIMVNYLDENLSPSLSRDFVVSGFGFKASLNGDPKLPTIYEGLESLSITFNQNGVHTGVKMGNKRRARFSAQLQQQLIVKGLAGSPSAYRVPNNVSSSFSLGLRTKI
mgnify:CR=1 FL=1